MMEGVISSDPPTRDHRVGSRRLFVSRSCILDGEAVACGDNGVPSFDRIRYGGTTPACSYSRST
jgi:hypothetical protein